MTTFALVIVAVGLGEPPTSVLYSSADKTLSIRFPATPTESERSSTMADKSEVVFKNAKVVSDGVTYALTKAEFTDAVVLEQPQRLLDVTVLGSLRTFGGTIKSIRRESFGPDKIPARRMVAELPNGYELHYLSVLRDGLSVQLTVFGKSDDVTDKVADEFFDSLKMAK